MKGLRRLVMLAMIITVLQVSCDILASFPLKFIPSKVQNTGNDPECLFPFLGPIESRFDIPQIDPDLQPDPRFAPGLPPEAQCPVDPNDPQGRIITVQHSTLGVIVFSLLMLVFFGLLSAALAFVDLYLAAYIGQQLTARMRNRLFDHLQRLSLDWHGKQRKGDLVQRITGNIADIEKLVTDGLVDLLAGILTLVGVTIVMLFLSVQYTLIALAVAPVLFVMVLGYTTGIKKAAKKAAKATGQVAHVATEDINALTLIKVFTREEMEAVRFGGYVDKNRRAGLRAGWLQAQFTPLVTLLVIIGTTAVIGVGGYVGAGNDFNLAFLSIGAYSVDIGTLILFLTFLKLLYQPMRDLSKLATLASTAASGAERIQEVLEQAPEVKESPIPGPYTGPQLFQGEITFENVVMGYLPETPVLKGINLHLTPGKKIGLVGLSGSGKTTLVKLIPRFYEIWQGTIKIDGVDNRLYPLDVLRNNVSMVLQDSVLFEGTIRENIAFGRPQASMEEVVAAAKEAYIHEMIMGLPDAYETRVSEQGNNFSGGQRQRIAIARAILRNAPILILDEPTASLDVEAETEVMRAISSLVVGRTVITISHRLSTLGHVDEILVMADGKIAQRGTFRELKYQEGIFADLLEEQNRYNLDRSEDEAVVRSAHAPRVRDRDSEQLYLATTPEIPAIKVTPVPVHLASVTTASVGGTAVAESVVLTKEIPDSDIDIDNGSDSSNNGHHSGDDGGSSGDGGGGGGGDSNDQQDGIAVGGWEGDDSADDDYLGPTVVVPRVRLRKAAIRVEIDGNVVHEYPLKKPRMTIGRLPTSDIPITSQRVSRFHALIHWRNGAWVIEDAESLNGLNCEGRRIDEMELTDGHVVHIDSSILLRYIEVA
jgi:ABC-type multidrug transport system fused ATPase/permease subunit